MISTSSWERFFQTATPSFLRELNDDAELNEVVEGNIENAAAILSARVHPNAYFASLPEYWNRLKIEFRALICTDDPKYADVREKARGANAVLDTLLLSGLIAALAKSVGVEAAILAPFVKLLIVSASKLGLSTFCALGGQIDPKAASSPAP